MQRQCRLGRGNIRSHEREWSVVGRGHGAVDWRGGVQRKLVKCCRLVPGSAEMKQPNSEARSPTPSASHANVLLDAAVEMPSAQDAWLSELLQRQQDASLTLDERSD